MMTKMQERFNAGEGLSGQYEIMFSPVLEVLGGRAQALDIVKSHEERTKNLKKVVYVSWKAIKPYQYVSGARHRYVIVRYESVMFITGQKVRKRSYQLGIKGKDSMWQFVNGDNLTSETYEELFPDFPKNVELPKLERVVEKTDAPGVKEVIATYRIGKTKFEQFKKDAGLIHAPAPKGVDDPPFFFQTKPTDVYVTDAASSWVIYGQSSHFSWSAGKKVNRFVYVVGDSERAISTLTFDNGILSEMEAKGPQ